MNRLPFSNGIVWVVDSFKQLLAWQIAMDLAVAIYGVSKSMPKEETYGLRAQIRNAASSIPGNISEGYGRNNRKEYIHFLGIAMGSLCEVETFYLLAIRLEQIEPNEEVEDLIKRAGQLLAKLKKSLTTTRKA